MAKKTTNKDNSVQIALLNDEYERIIAAKTLITEISSPFFDAYPSEYATFSGKMENITWVGEEIDWWRENFMQLYNDTASKIISDIATLKDNLLSAANNRLYKIDDLED